jgi:mannose-1-phosphate guanylyltransferase
MRLAVRRRVWVLREWVTTVYCAIIAGGGGTRLWPKSRRRLPKQLLALQGGVSLFEMAAERVHPLCGDDRLYVVTSQELAPAMRQALPYVPSEHVIAEPAARQTALAIGLAAITVEKRDPTAILATVGADHLIDDVEGFRFCVRVAVEAASSGDYLITIGVRPTSPHTGYGYIQMGDQVHGVSRSKVNAVKSFKEKPDRATAQAYLNAGDYVWNTNYFVWSVASIMRAFERHAPATYAGLRRIQEALGTSREGDVAREVFSQLPAEPIDTAILEMANNILVVPAEFDWIDVGNWSDMYIVADEHEANHVVGSGTAPVLFEGSSGCLVHRSNRLVALIGVEDLVVVDTDDAVLVLPKHRDQDVRRIVDRLRREGLDHYL